jgi:hypothetical protein
VAPGKSGPPGDQALIKISHLLLSLGILFGGYPSSRKNKFSARLSIIDKPSKKSACKAANIIRNFLTVNLKTPAWASGHCDPGLTFMEFLSIIKTMGRYSKKNKALFLFLFSLFLMEYMEPSAIGVRAYVDFPLTQEIPDRENSPITHAMGLSGPAEFSTTLLVNSVIPLPIIPSRQSVFFKIYRPPLPHLQPL